MAQAEKTDEVLDRLTMLYPKAIAPGLERTLRILHDLGDPHLALPPVIHIAGTNGKGSTLAFIRAIAETAGLTVHAMTSPHLVRFNERLVISGEEISDDTLLALLQEAEALNDNKPVTFFEITTAAGFLAFSRAKANLCLLETGMGGRLDSTNVVPQPLVTIITNISHDHMQFLGSDLKSIAFEKAGIMKAGVPCVIGPQTEAAIAAGVPGVFAAHAESLNAPLPRHGYEWSYEENHQGFEFTFQGERRQFPAPNLTGRHQIANAATAIAAIKAAGLEIETDVIRKGLQSARWPARLQRITEGPLTDLLPPYWELWLDGGHNEDGGRILAEQAGNWATDQKPLHLILGMLTTKDPKEFYNHLRPYAASAHAIVIPDEKLAFTADMLAQRLKIASAQNIEDAIQKIVSTQNRPGRILIAGSLYLAGHVLKKV